MKSKRNRNGERIRGRGVCENANGDGNGVLEMAPSAAGGARQGAPYTVG